MSMLKKFGLVAAIAGTFWLLVPTSFSPSDAAPLPPSLSLKTLSAESDPIEFIRRLRVKRERLASAGIGVFIIPGVYWGPAWWDRTYARVCWKLIRPCRNCAENWIYIC
jgi:hypothetical protein